MLDRTWLHGNGLLHGSLGGRCGVSGYSRGTAYFETGLVACQTACLFITSTDGSDRDGPDVLPDGSLAALRWMLRRMPGNVPDGLGISFRFETGLAACATVRSCPFGGSALGRMVRFEMGPASCTTARSWRFSDCQTARATTASHIRLVKEYACTPDPPGCGPEPKATRSGWSDNRIRPLVSRTAPFPQLIAGFKSRPHISPWLRPRGLYPQWGSYLYRPTCCLSDPSYLPPKLSSPSHILLSPYRSTVIPLAALRSICTLVDGSIRNGPGDLPGGSFVWRRRNRRIETDPASCPTTRSYRFGVMVGLRQARHLARRLTCVCSV